MSNVLSIHFIGILSIVLSLVQPLSDGSATIDNEPSRGDLTVTIVGSDGAALSGACFAVSDSNGGSTGGCVGGGGSGTVYGLPAGNVSVRQTSGPSGYTLAGSRSGNVPENGTGSVTLTAAAVPVVVPEEPVVVPEEPDKTEDTKTDINNDTKTDTNTDTKTDTKTEIQVVPEDTGSKSDTTTDTTSTQQPTPTPDANVGRLTTELTSLASSDFGILAAGDIAVSCRYTPGSTTADFTVQVTDKPGTAAFSYVLTAFDLQGDQAHQETITDQVQHAYTEPWRRITVAVNFSDGTTGSATAGCNSYPLETGISTLAETTSGSAVHDGDRVDLGTAIRDTATLTNQSVDAAGSVTYYLYESGSSCEPGTHVFSSGPHPVVDGVVEDSDSYAPANPGSYDWVAVYSGDLAQGDAQSNSHFNSPATSTCGDETVIVGQVSPSITTAMQWANGDPLAHLSSVPFGTDVRDTAVLQGATEDAGGQVTYTLYEGTCPGTPVSGASFTVDVTNGSVPPSGAVNDLPQGTYHWVVTYTGDEKNAGATSGCGEETFSVGKAQPTVTTTMHEEGGTQIDDGGSVPVGTVSYDTAEITGGSAPYTGTVTYTLHYSATGSDTCNTENVEYSSGALNIVGGEVPPSGNHTLDKVGTWNWVVTYSGDAGNESAVSTCGTETVNVDPITPSIATEIHNTSGDAVVPVGTVLPAGSSVHDTATLGGIVDGLTPTGSVTYYLYHSYLCETPVETYGAIPLNADGTLPDSPDTGALGNGTWNWVVIYSGDDNYQGAISGCGDEQFFIGQGQGGISTLVKDADDNGYPDGSEVIVDSVLHDTAVLYGVTPDASGTVDFFVYAGGNCNGNPISVGSATVATGEVQGTSDDYTFDTQGVYQWVAVYSGDDNNASVTSECGAETIEIVGRPSSVTTTMYTADGTLISDNTKVLAGTTVYDTAVVTSAVPGEVNPPEVTGTLTYTLYSDANCDTVVDTFTKAVGENSDNVTPSTPSIYNWVVEYSGDDDYASSISGCGQETFFLALQPTITTMMVDENREEIANGSELTAGDQIGDTATLTGATGNAGGTVTYNFYLGDSCSGDLVYAPQVNVSNGVVEDSPVVTPPFLGDWSIQAVYSGDELNYPATSMCGDENFSLALDSTPSVSTTMKADNSVIAHEGHIEFLPADVSDTLNLFGVLPGSTGDITFELYKGTSCSGTPVFTDTQEDVVAQNGSLSFESDAHTLTADDWGTYNWRVTWNGDVNGDESSDTLISECGEETFIGVTQYPYTAGITCTYHGEDDTTSYRVDANKRTSLDPDINPQFTAVVTPTDNLLNPLSPITYHAYDSDNAPNPPVNFSHQDWRQISVLITWPDGQTWTGTASCNENPLTPELTTGMMLDGETDTPIGDGDSVSLGDTVYDTTTLTGGTVTRTGTLTYTLYQSTTCAEGTVVFGPESHTLSGSELPDSGTYTPTEPGTYNWVVSYSGDNNNEAAISECGEETFTVAGPDIAVTKVAVDDEVNAGEDASFTITVDNIGAGRADNVTLSDTLPAGVSWTIDPAVTGCEITVVGETRTLECSFGSMAPDDDPISITVTGATDATDCGPLDNPAATGAASNEAQDEDTLSNNTASASIDVICADVTVEKVPTTEEGAVISAGDTASFTITVSNIGPIDATNVTVSDELPGGVNWALVSPATGCAITGTAPQVLDCSFATLASGASQDIIVSGATDAADCDTITNEMVTVSASNEGSEATENNTSDPASITVECPDVEVSKSTTTPFISAGDTASFTITVDNNGEGRADNVTVTDTLPEGVAWAIDPAVEGCEITVAGATRTLECTFDSLAAGGSQDITVTGQTDPADCGTITNESAQVSAGNEPESAGGDNTSGSASIEVECPDIEVLKTPTTEEGGVISAGDIASFTITINNIGDGRADDIEFTDVLPEDVNWSISSAVAGCGIGTDNRTLNCSVDSLAADGSIVITVVGTTDASDCGTLDNSSARADAGNEPQDANTLANNVASSSITVQCPDVTIEKSPTTEEDAVISAGDTASFTFTVTNIGNGRADNVTVLDFLPTGVTWTIDPVVGGCEITGTLPRVSCSFESLAAGASFSVTVTGVTDAEDCGDLPNQAIVGATNEALLQQDNNGDGASINVLCPEMSITKVPADDTVSSGDDVSYTITAINNGEGNAYNVTVTDELPAAVTWELVSPVSGCEITGTAPQTLTCDFGTMATKSQQVITLTGTTAPGFCGDLRNTAYVTSTNEPTSEEVQENNSGVAEIDVDCPDIEVTKAPTTDAGAVISAGDTASFTITVDNIGDGRADNVTLNDTLPVGVVWSIVPEVEGCSITDGVNLSCDFDSMAPDDPAISITVIGATSAENCGPLNNPAATGAASNEPQDEQTLANNSDDASIQVDCADIEVRKTTTTPTISAGDTASFTITVDNVGVGRADNVTVSDELPTGVSWTIDPAVTGCEITVANGIQTLDCAFEESLAPSDAPFSVTVVGTTDAADCGPLVNPSATGGASNEPQDEETLDNNTSGSATIDVDCPDIEVGKTTTTPIVSAGDTASFTITVSNKGDGRADDVTVTDTLPSGVAWAITPPVDGCAIAADGVTLSCSVESMASGVSFDIVVTGTTDPTDCGSLLNPSASATVGNEGEGTLEDNTSGSASIEVDCPDIKVTKSTTTPTVSAGDAVSFTITVDNIGDGRADDVTLNDTLPAGVAWTITPAVSGCEITVVGETRTLECSFGSMAPDDDPISITVTGTTDATDCGPLVNPSATAGASNEGDDKLTNNEDSASIEVDCPDIEILKAPTTEAGAVISAGDTASFTITVSNKGDGRADDVTVTDMLPVGVAWAITPPVDGCAIAADGVTLSCSVESMAPGASFSIIVTGATDAADCGMLLNPSAAAGASNEPRDEETLDNNEASSSIEVDCPDIKVEKTTTTPVVSAGDAVSFTITVDNVGEGRADNVTLTDTLPAGVAWSIDPEVAGCEITDGVNLDCDFGSVEPEDAAITITVTGMTDATDCGTLLNPSASATATNEGDDKLANNEASASIEVDCPDIEVTKSTTTPTVSAGDGVSFTMTVENIGKGRADGVTLTDTLPAGVDWIIDPAVDPDVANCSIIGTTTQVLSCDIGTMATGESFAVTVTGITDVADCGSLDNPSASAAASNEGEDDLGNNSDEASIEVDCPDIKVEKSTETPVVSAADDVSFTITVSNIGEGRADNVTLTDTLPADVDWSIDPEVDGCAIDDDGTLTCDIGTMPADGEPFSVTVTGTTDAEDCGLLVNPSASASASNESVSEEDEVLDNNSDDAEIQVLCPEMSVTKVPADDVVSSGDRVSYTITAINNGEGNAYNVEVTDELPAGIDWTMNPVVDGCAIVTEGGTQKLDCDFGTMATGAEQVITVTGLTEPGVCGELQNRAYVTSTNESTSEEVQQNNSGLAEIDVDCPDVEVEKTTSTPTISAGDTASFTITVDNIGEGRADDVRLTDTLPSGVAWTIDPAVAGCEISDAGVLTCNIGTMAADGEPFSVTVTGVTDAADCGSLDNTASALGSNESKDSRENNSDEASITVDCPDIEVTKITDTATVSAGDDVRFTIAVDNIGDGRADNVTLDDILPAGVAWTITPPVEGCAIAADGVTLSCNFGSIAPDDAPISITVTGTTDAADCGTLINPSASGSASNEGEDTLDDNEASASIEVDCPDVEVEKTTTTPVVSAGDDVSFTITVSNVGDGRADNVMLSDTLPAGVAWAITPAVEGCAIADDGVTLSCDFGSLASNGEPFTVIVTGVTDAADCGSLDNLSATGSASNEAENALGNNEASASIEVDCPDIEVTKTSETPVVSAGDDVSFTITVDNVGDGRADGVTLTDGLPAGVAWVIDPEVEGCAIAEDGVTLSCDFGTMAPDDAPISITVSGTTDAADCGSLDNLSASASASNEGEDTLDDNEASASIEVDCPDIEVEKTTTTPVVSAGDGVSYTITATNVGDGRADGVTLTDTLPAGVAWTIDPAVDGCEIGDDGILTCTIGTMAADGEPFSVTVTGLTAAENCGILANTASATAGNESVSDEDAVLANNTDDAEIQVLCPEMSVTKAAGDATVSSGDEVSYTITAINNGEGNAYNVEVTDTLPAGVVWSIEPAVEGCAITDVEGRQELTCDFGTMASGAEHLVTVTGTTEPGFCGELQNRAYVTSTNESTSEEVQENNSGLAEIAVDCPDIEVEKTTETPVVSAGNAVSFTVTVANAGDGRADGVTLTDELPTGVDWTIDPAVEGCEISDDGVLTCAIGTMGPESEPFSVTVTAATDATNCGTLNNVAEASATNETETLLGNNSDEASVTVDCPDIEVEKTTETPVVSAGDAVSFMVTVTNIGDGTANDVELTDELPSGIAWTIDPAVEGCEISDEGVLTCAIGTMAPDDVFSVTVTGTAETVDCGTLANTASATASNEGDGALDNNSDAASIAVNCPDIEVEKTTDTPVVSAGDAVSFTVTATNIGDGTANNVELTDELPSGIAWTINPAVDGCEISDEGVLTCSVEAMESGDSIAVTVVGETTPADCGTLANTANASASNEGAAKALVNNEASASIVVNCPDIEVEKTADAASVSASDRVSFTITATNIGEGRADEVVLTDALPEGFNWTVTGDLAATCEVVDGSLICSIGTLEAGASTAIVVSAPATMSQCGTVQNAVSVEAGNEPGSVLDNNVAEAETEITCPPAPTPTPGLDPDTREPVTMLPVTGSGDQAGTSSMAALWALVIAAMLALAGMATLTVSGRRERSR